MSDNTQVRRQCVNATHVDNVRIEVLGGSRAVTMPASLILDVHDALQTAGVEDLLRDTADAINSLNGEHYEAEKVLCRVTTLCVELLAAGS